MLVLGIETSCDETAVALYDGEKGLVSFAPTGQADRRGLAPALRGGGLHGVSEQVHERAAQENFRARDGGKRAVESHSDARKGGLRFRRRGRRHACQVDGLRGERFGPGEQEKVTGDAAHLLGLAADRLEVLGCPVGVPQGKVGETVDRRACTRDRTGARRDRPAASPC